MLRLAEGRRRPPGEAAPPPPLRRGEGGAEGADAEGEAAEDAAVAVEVGRGEPTVTARSRGSIPSAAHNRIEMGHFSRGGRRNFV